MGYVTLGKSWDAGQAVLLKITSYLSALRTQGQALCCRGLSLINGWMGSMNCKWKHYWCHLHLRIKWSGLPSQQILVYTVYCDWQRHESASNRSCRRFMSPTENSFIKASSLHVTPLLCLTSFKFHKNHPGFNEIGPQIN